MNSAVCTLFEGHYHYGVGVLANSLYAQGFRGTLYVGYRGDLPPWAAEAKNEAGCTEFNAAAGLMIRFIPLTTKFHLTNFKPDFMLDLWKNHCPLAQALFYFDPDITVICRWTFFEDWVQSGVAMCADVNPSMPSNHPVRAAWKTFYQPSGIVFRRETDIYFNGGFVGLKLADLEYLHCWQRLQELMAPEIGGLKNVNVRDRTYLFHKTDQDAMNVAAMACVPDISPMGQDGMDLQQGGGGYVMSHAVGGQKPWKKQFVRLLLQRGWAPSRADRIFFRHVKHPIRLYSAGELAVKQFFLLLASGLARFIGR